MTVFQFRSIERFILGATLLATVCAGCGRGPKIPTASVSGTVTINGKGVPAVEVAFVPVEKIRPAIAYTDGSGRYTAQFLTNQSGVPLGACVVQISYCPQGGPNVLPDEFSAKAAENPALNLVVPKEGTTFDFDVKTDQPLP
jgi:hypothetical protein